MGLMCKYIKECISNCWPGFNALASEHQISLPDVMFATDAHKHLPARIIAISYSRNCLYKCEAMCTINVHELNLLCVMFKPNAAFICLNKAIRISKLTSITHSKCKPTGNLWQR